MDLARHSRRCQASLGHWDRVGKRNPLNQNRVIPLKEVIPNQFNKEYNITPLLEPAADVARRNYYNWNAAGNRVNLLLHFELTPLKNIQPCSKFTFSRGLTNLRNLCYKRKTYWEGSYQNLSWGSLKSSCLNLSFRKTFVDKKQALL